MAALDRDGLRRQPWARGRLCRRTSWPQDGRIRACNRAAHQKAAIRHHGADLRDDAPDYDTAEQLAREAAASTGAVYVALQPPDVIAGARTVALELLDSSPSVDAVIVPVGGGGLISASPLQ